MSTVVDDIWSQNNVPLDLKLSQVHPAIPSWQEVHGIYGHNF